MNTAILPRALLPVLVLAAVALFLLNGAVNGGRYDQQLLAMAGVWALVVLGYQFSFGHAGALNLAQGAFFGVGAYTSAILARSYGLDFAVTLPAAVALSAALGVAVALPVLRLKSHYFALATLAVAQLAYLGAVNWQGLTGGANGLPGVPGLRVFGFGLSGAGQLVLVWGLVAAAALFAARLTRGRLGLAFTVSRETPLAAGTIGISVGRLRLAALGLGAAYAGAAGALQVHILRVVSPEVLHFSVLVTCLTMTVIGGRVSVAGGIAAALLLTHLPEWFRGFESYYLVANGGVLLAVVLFAPA
ncbi:MAG: branched-chain amino acid ABC transporter permease, partial [Alphaproteobacteria bacterium]|nr:branched-chain amino acid ABC transporter permease [Alphaproteobacteria bacterium]